jgi:hypothetical protein
MKCIPDQNIFAIERDDGIARTKYFETSIITESHIPIGARMVTA